MNKTTGRPRSRLGDPPLETDDDAFEVREIRRRAVDDRVLRLLQDLASVLLGDHDVLDPDALRIALHDQDVAVEDAVAAEVGSVHVDGVQVLLRGAVQQLGHVADQGLVARLRASRLADVMKRDRLDTGGVARALLRMGKADAAGFRAPREVVFLLQGPDVGEDGRGFDVEMLGDLVDGRRHLLRGHEFVDELDDVFLFLGQTFHGWVPPVVVWSGTLELRTPLRRRFARPFWGTAVNSVGWFFSRQANRTMQEDMSVAT